MAKLSLRIQTDLGVEIEHAVVANGLQLTDAQGRPPDEPHAAEAVIPAGWNAWETIDCPPGLYRIAAYLPSGDMVQVQRSVAEFDKPTQVELSAGGSQREWLSWQTFSGAGAL